MSNLNDFFGGTGSSSGSSGGSGVQRLDDLIDVSIASVANGQVLRYEGTGWFNTKLSYSDIQNTPAIPTTLGTLSDVNTAGATSGQVLTFNGTTWVPLAGGGSLSLDNLTDVVVSSPAAGQVVTYNGSTWLNSTLSYTNLTNKPTIPTLLADLSNVADTAASANQYLKYDGSNWNPVNIAYADITGTPTIPTNGSFTFIGLSDTDNAPVANGFVRWNSSGTSLSYSTTIASTAITGLSTVATSGNFSDLNGVSLSGATSGQLLTYNGSNWVPQTPAAAGQPGLITDSGSNTYVSVVNTTDDIVMQAGPTSGNITLKTAGSGKVQLQGNPVINSGTTLTITATSGVTIGPLKWPTADGVNGQVLATNGAGVLSFVDAATGTGAGINWQGVWSATNYAKDDAVFYNGTSWICTTNITSGASTPPSISNTNWNILSQGFEYKGAYSSGATYYPQDVVTYNGSSYVVLPTVSSPVSGTDPSNTGTWGLIAQKGDTGAAGSGASQLNQLSDVVSSTPTSGNVLRANGSGWTSAKLAYSDLSGTPTLATVATSGSYTDLTSKPSIPTNNSFTFVGLSDTNDTVVANGYLRWDASGTSIGYATTIPSTAVSGLATVASTGSYNDLTNKPTIPTALSGLSDVNTTTTPPTNGQSLVYNSATSKWIPGTVSGGGGSTALSGLTDVTLSSPANTQVLKYNGSAWVNAAVAYSEVTGTPTIPTNNSFTFIGLSDTDNSAVANGYLVWNSGGTSISYSTTIPAASITGLSTVATSGSYADLSNKPTIPTALSGLSDVNVTTPAPTNGQALVYNSSSSKWVPGTVSSGGGVGTGSFSGEWVRILYTAGDLINTITSSSGVTATIATNSSNTNVTINLTFTGKSYPPTNWTFFGYDVVNTRYAVKMRDTSTYPQYITTSAADNPFGSFSSTSCAMNSFQVQVGYTGATKNGPTNPAHAYILFTW